MVEQIELNKTNSLVKTQPIDVNIKIKNYILDWCSYSTAHGISNLSRIKSRSVLIVWLILYISSITFCIYGIINILIAFFHYHTLINMEFQTELPTDFPAVTFCNLNPIDKRKSNHYIEQVLNKNNISHVTNLSLIDIDPEIIFKLIKSSIISHSSLNQFDFGFTLDYILLKCQFNGFICNESDFIKTINYDFGNCFTFNSGFDSFGNKMPIKTISEAGSDKSFQLELFLGDEYLQSEFLMNSGARVIVHNQSITPILTSEGRDVASGYLTNIGITRSFFKKLSKPYSNCIEDVSNPFGYDSVYFKAIFQYLNMSLYRQKNCLPLCLQDYLKNECNCLDASIPIIYEEIDICTSLHKLECIKQKRLDYFRNSSLTTLCYESCPLECETSI
jgi:hypothetical protein